MSKKRWKLSICLFLVLLAIPKLTNTLENSKKGKCTSLTSLQRQSLRGASIIEFCDNVGSCECKKSTYKNYCYIADDCVGCMHSGQVVLCSQYGGQTTPPASSYRTSQECDSDEFLCGGECKDKADYKDCKGECVERTEICNKNDEPCKVPHDLNAIDWKCGDKCKNDYTREKSGAFDCNGQCLLKNTYKVCSNGKCNLRSKVCEGDDDPCEVRHDDKASYWKCGKKCKKGKKETSDRIDCDWFCGHKSTYKSCNGKCVVNSVNCEKTTSSKPDITPATKRSTEAPTKPKTNSGIEKPDADDNDLNIIAIIIPVVLVVILIAALISVKGFFLQKKKRKKSMKIVYLPGDIPEHRILEKNDDLLDNISQAAKEKTPNKEEFKSMQEYVRVNINETTDIGKLEENKDRNRYCDILPYDSNIINLKKPTGDPPLTYMNASMISFPELSQNFIASMAPKENMVSSFWQMILDQDVKTIVMITGLVEGRKTKAHQYWPDIEEPDMDLDNGFKLRYETHSFHETYYQRRITLTDSQGKERSIEQLQTTAWLDMTAPKETKILLDLVYKAQELAGDPNMGAHAASKSTSPKTKKSKKSPMLVHCSAGVGRTGTFIALYKLVVDYNNERVKNLDVFSTVVKMREQRMNMVQKHQQYEYIIKCLHHYVVAQTDIYQQA